MPKGTDPKDIRWLRDRALIATLIDTWGRVGAVCEARVADYQIRGERFFLRLHEKDTKIQSAEISPSTQKMIDEYLRYSPPNGQESYLFRSSKGRGEFRSSENPFLARNVRLMLLHRANTVGLSNVHPHMLRVGAMNDFRRQGGSLSDAKRKMEHKSDRRVVYYEMHVWPV